jgi:hypothetical protein
MTGALMHPQQGVEAELSVARSELTHLERRRRVAATPGAEGVLRHHVAEER